MSGHPVKVELHCHSSLSDGAAPPEKLAEVVAGAGVTVASLTDHDTVEGCGRFRDALAGTGVACIDGVEITAVAGQREIHVLGYGIDPDHVGLRAALSANRLKVDPGLPGLVDTMKRMGSRSARAGASVMSAPEAIDLVHSAGGKAFIAHPLSGSMGRDELLRRLPDLAAAGLDGIEAAYAPYPDEERRWLEGVAAQHRLVVSGGSDFHGPEQVPGPEPGVQLSAAQWKAFRDLLLPGERPMDRTRSPREAPRPALAGRFAARIVLPAAAAVVMFVVALFAVAIPRFERVLLERKKEMIRELANEATSILREYAAEERAGRLSAGEARRGAADRVRDLRYGKDGKDYFWITDMRPVMIVHPYRPELEGTDVSEYRDANGVQVFVEFVKAVRDRDQGYVEYLWQWKDDAHRIVPKLSFVERFPAWDWVIGTGIYLDDVQAEIVGMARWMIWLSLGITAALALLLAFLTHQSLAVERGRQTAEARLRESHERYRALVEASSEGMVLLVDGAFTFANRTFLDMTGYSASQLPLVGLTELIRPHEGDEPAHERFLAVLARGAAADSAGPAPLACRLARREGERVEAVLNASPFVVAGRAGWILAARTVTAATADGPVAALSGAAPVGMFRAKWGRSPALAEANEAGTRMLALAGDPEGTTLLEQLRQELSEEPRVERLEVGIVGEPNDARSFLVSAILGPVQSDGSRYVEGMLEDVTDLREADRLFDAALARIERAETVLDLATVRGLLPGMVHRLLDGHAGLPAINRRITRISDMALRGLIASAIRDLGEPPAPFAFLVLGSEGREETSLGSDQDNAIVYADGAADDPAGAPAWFHALGVKVCRWLEQTGIPPCTGGMMASNPRWCAPLSAWDAMFGRWIAAAEPQELLDFQVCFDFRAVYGDRSLAERLRAAVAEHLAGEPPFFLHLARDALNRKPPQLPPADSRGSADQAAAIKGAMLPFVGFARLYALKRGVEATNTLARLQALEAAGVITRQFHRDIARAFRCLTEARLRHQVRAVHGSGRGDDLPDANGMRRALELAVLLQKRISFDFLGSAL